MILSSPPGTPPPLPMLLWHVQGAATLQLQVPDITPSRSPQSLPQDISHFKLMTKMEDIRWPEHQSTHVRVPSLCIQCGRIVSYEVALHWCAEQGTTSVRPPSPSMSGGYNYPILEAHKVLTWLTPNHTATEWCCWDSKPRLNVWVHFCNHRIHQVIKTNTK